MIDNILQIVAPHHCYGCQKFGRALCSDCKYDIIQDPFSGCVVCARPSNLGVCTGCKSTYDTAWCVGDRIDTLKHLLNAYKFEHVRSAARDISDLLDATVPTLPPNAVIVPIPTIPAHVRERGYDHVQLLAKEFAKRRGLRIQYCIRRVDNTHQRGLTKKQRFDQAKTAFIAKSVASSTPYVIIDDVLTTNATVRFAAQALRDDGAERVWVAVVARQPLEK